MESGKVGIITGISFLNVDILRGKNIVSGYGGTIMEI